MKGYVVTLMDMPASVDSANRCVQSGEKFGIDITLFPAVNKTDALHELKSEGLVQAKFNEKYSNVGAVLGNFVSQYRIWKLIVETNTPAIVFEHDAVVLAAIPELEGDIVNLGKPSYGNFAEKSVPGIYPLYSKKVTEEYGRYLPGAHGYYVSVQGAKNLIEKAHRLGASPIDVFINTKNFPDIREVSPWPVEAHDSFTTIQKVAGCTAKHNYNPHYKIFY